MAGRRNRPWSEDEDRRLLELKAAGRSARIHFSCAQRSAGAIEDGLAFCAPAQKQRVKETGWHPALDQRRIPEAKPSDELTASISRSVPAPRGIARHTGMRTLWRLRARRATCG